MIQRAHIVIRGAVQGVGFRPFVFRLATELDLKGWVCNSNEGVFVEVQGENALIEDFILRLETEKPARSFIQSLESKYLDPESFQGFEIRPSRTGGARNTLVLPDIATCAECLSDIRDPANRRYRYPFTNCTHCGPRYTIVESLPYDRRGTSMKIFAMCEECRKEYEDPRDRRFHAQPNACPSCGPQLELWDANGNVLAGNEAALRETAAAIRDGRIAAVKGLGGFHLMVDARNEDAVTRLRCRKQREEKPLALLFPRIQMVEAQCLVSRLEARLLLSPESPIVLLQRRRTLSRDETPIAPSVAPGNPNLGVMLPYTPLHHLLMQDIGFPVVATSGNVSEEPICIDEREALERLNDIADLFLVHDRPIVRHTDDSIVRIVRGRELILRRARGYAPLPLRLVQDSPVLLAVGAHLKNSIALSVGTNVFLSQHIGDLETPRASAAFQRAIADFRNLYEVRPAAVVSDLHPDYLSTKYAQSCGLPSLTVQHHMAHVAACMAENELQDPVLGVSWDGTGLGMDGTIWGGEFLKIDGTPVHRVATLRGFRLPGASSAIREPRRTALGVLYEACGDSIFDGNALLPFRSFSRQELRVLRHMLATGLNAPVTSSAGRLFDAVASIAGLRQIASFEGQAAMELEFAVTEGVDGESYPFSLEQKPGEGVADHPLVADWGPVIRGILEDLGTGVPPGVIAARFHRTLSEIILAVARRIALNRVVLTGGCFQNRFLTECTIERLESAGFRPYWHQRIPPNDGGIAIGQICAALRSRPGGGERDVPRRSG